MFSTKPTTHRLEPTRLTTQCHGLTCVYSSSLLRYNFWSLANELNGSILFFSSELRVFLFHLPGSVCEFRASIGGGIHPVHAHGVGEALFVGHLQNVVITRMDLFDLGIKNCIFQDSVFSGVERSRRVPRQNPCKHKHRRTATCFEGTRGRVARDAGRNDATLSCSRT